jgi:hypothetical protein
MSDIYWRCKEVAAREVVIDRKRFRPSIRPKIIGRIFGPNEYSASAAKNEKSLIKLLYFEKPFFKKVNFKLAGIFNVLCMHALCGFCAHKSTGTGNCHPRKHFFSYRNLTFFSNVYCLVPNIRYRPNIRQHFLAEYSFLAETRKSVFGRSLSRRFGN